MADENLSAPIESAFAAMKLEGARHHVFLCVGPNCCSSEQGLAVWDYLKQTLKSRGVSVLRTKAACLRVCVGGPWMLVYPEGIWYGQIDIGRCERIIREHLLGGVPVTEWVVKRHPMVGPPDDPV